MAKNDRCGCGRRNSNSYGCLNSLGGRWENYPYYPGPCPSAEGVYDCFDEKEEVVLRGQRAGARRGTGSGIFSTMLPVAVAANGLIPLVNNGCQCDAGIFSANYGVISVEEAGTYLATYTVRVPEGETLESTFSLNVNGAAQSSSIVQTGGAGPCCFTGQAIFTVCDPCSLTLQSAEAINITTRSVQPLVTLSLVKI